MEMFTSLQQVDEHVKRLLKISKNDDDIDVQCYTISKLYFDVKEFDISKSYIEKYLKAKSNSQPGYFLKAKIHEELKEYEMAFHCYENLYNISNKKDYITKACENLLKSNCGSKWAQLWTEILEKEIPESSLLIQMKTKFARFFQVNFEKIQDLENKMQNDKSNQFKREYLSILESNSTSIDSLSKCIEVINKYEILDDITLVKSCIKIFQNDLKSEDASNKVVYCLLLISIVKNVDRCSEYDRLQYLVKLYDLLKLENNQGLFKPLKIQFLYHWVSYIHFSNIESNSEENFHSIYSAYLSLVNDSFIPENEIPKHLHVWLSHQFLLRKSIINHIVYYAKDSFKGKVNNWIEIISNMLPKSDIANFKDIKNMFNDVETELLKNIDKLISTDVSCYSSENTDFTLLVWHLMCYMNTFSDEDKCNIKVSSASVQFINSFINSLFPQLPMKLLHNRCPENICKTDIVTFFLGTVLTYKTSHALYDLPIPFEYIKLLIKVNDTTEKWWQSACDFLLNNKRNTSIGVKREFLKKGLELIQVTDNLIPESLKLQLGRALANFANIADVNKEAIFERSISFLYSVIKNNERTLLNKTVPKTSFSSQSILGRQIQFNSPFNAIKNVVLFDTKLIPNEIMLNWRFEAYICYIDWKLKLESYGDEVDLYELQDLIDSANIINSNHPSLDILKSKLYLSIAMKLNDVSSLDKYSTLLSDASKYASKCAEHLYFVERQEREALELVLQEQLDAIEAAKVSDYSVLNFTSLNESTNNNGKSYQTMDSSRCATFNKDNFDFERLESALASVDNDKLSEKVDSCLQIVGDIDDISRDNKHDIKLLKMQSERQYDLIRNLVIKFENINRKLETFANIEDNYLTAVKENTMFKQQLKSLNGVVGKLEIKNLELELSCSKFQRTARFTNMLNKELNNFSNGISYELCQIQSAVEDNLDRIEIFESKLLKNFLKRREGHISKKKETIKTEEVAFDLSRFSKDKWECPTCMVNNDDSMDSCPACTTPKPSQKKTIFSAKAVKNVISNNDFDLSRFNKDKWECPSCMVNNDNTLSSCPACTTAKPSLSKPIDKGKTLQNIQVVQNVSSNNGFDLSKYTRDKWECSTCMVNNDNNLTTCPACNTQKPNSLHVLTKDTKVVSSQKDNTEKIMFGSANPIKFGSNSNKGNVVPLTFGKPCVGFTFGAATKNNMTEVKKDTPGNGWECECTTSNSNDSKQCIACGEKRMDDDDVIFISEPFVTEDQVKRARSLQLPDHFYYFENLPDNEGMDNDSDVDILPRVLVAAEQVNDNDENPENYDPYYNPIIELPVAEIVTGEEGWNEMYSKRCKLFKFRENNWVERGIGEMKIITQEKEGKVSARLLMRREQVQKVCCNHLIVKNCPNFTPMGTSTTTNCWYAKDFSDMSNPETGNFAIRFKTELELIEFKTKVADLQSRMENN